jgi:hypothetical protein
MSRKQFVFRYLYAFELGLAKLNRTFFPSPSHWKYVLYGTVLYISINPNMTNRMLYNRGLGLSGYQNSFPPKVTLSTTALLNVVSFLRLFILFRQCRGSASLLSVSGFSLRSGSGTWPLFFEVKAFPYN